MVCSISFNEVRFCLFVCLFVGRSVQDRIHPFGCILCVLRNMLDRCEIREVVCRVVYHMVYAVQHNDNPAI
jgi:hypothetical protein